MTSQPRTRPRITVVVSRDRAMIVAAAIGLLACMTVASAGLALAMFTARSDVPAVFGTKALFPGERTTPAFRVGDSSSGSLVDSSSPFAFAADGLTTSTSAWSTSFASNRYLEFDLNASLASGVAVSAATFDFRFASTGAGQVCYDFEVRRISTGEVLGTYGSPGTPIGCVTGTTLTSFSTPIASLATTSNANDLRIRLFADESTSGAMRIDLATVSGSTSYQGFTLYPVVVRDASDTTTQTIPWMLDLP